MFNLEMNSNKEIALCGCFGILDYLEDNILLDFSTYAIRITGSDLSMLSYSCGEIYIEGTILRIEFESLDQNSAERAA